MNIDKNELDRHITGNWGEDQAQGGDEPEFYAPWRVVKLIRPGVVADMAFAIYDDNGNVMAYAEDDFFLTEAIGRINDHDDQQKAHADALTLLRWASDCWLEGGELRPDFDDCVDAIRSFLPRAERDRRQGDHG